MGQTVFTSPIPSKVNLDASTVRYKVIVSKTLGDSQIQLKIKSMGDPNEPGYIRLGMELEDYVRALARALRCQHWFLRYLPDAWMQRASDAVIVKLKRESIRII